MLIALMQVLSPGTGWPEPGGLLPREALYLLGKIVERAPYLWFEVVEVSPPYDVSDMTALLAARVIDTMGHLVVSGQLPRKPHYIHPEAQPELVNGGQGKCTKLI